VDIEAGDPAGEMPYLFRVTGSVVLFPGFLRVYRDLRRNEGQVPPLPPLSQQEVLDLLQLVPKQHFTKPPPRYSEATLVRALEEHGIGRPSTYAPILSTIQTRGYVQLVERRFHPTDLGFIVNDLLVEHFGDIVDLGFTARMEENLDLIASGEKEWVPVLRRFYDRFEGQLERATEEMKKIELVPELAGIDCDKCGSPMVIKMGRYGKFIACSNYPECKNTKPYVVKVGVECPRCGGDLVERKSRKGRVFYGCANYPECNFATWDRPVPEPCPQCGGLLTQSAKNSVKCTECGTVLERAPQEDEVPEAEIV
jgi:DNA topoisomerase-1